MYLKQLELIGFKSFAEKTRLDFEPGMTAIVGPNGCGKSNVSDAIRWVLGEKSAKALRGQSMEDCIFTGTDTHKPLGMAEVSLTLTDCEDTLGTDYHEVTVTRRVFRSGEGQYLMNRTPCRLKDIQRLFMDTGVGTNAYSILEQGRIDQILSARPDDRRAVFEEASGITKYKADKKEAIRKLDHTEANLLRLADIIREVKRQIISMQRQAGKARRYKDIQTRLRSLDLYLTGLRLNELQQDIDALNARHDETEKSVAERREKIQASEARIVALREALQQSEQAIEELMEAVSAGRGKLNHTREAIEVNAERIQELKQLSDRDSRDAEMARRRLEEHEASLTSLHEEWTRAQTAAEEAEQALDARAARHKQVEDRLEALTQRLHAFRNEAMDIESRLAALQNESADIDARERSTIIRRERLTAEKAELEQSAEHIGGRERHMDKSIGEMERDVQAASEQCAALNLEQSDGESRKTELRTTLEGCRSKAAAVDARMELLKAQERESAGFPAGARRLLDAESDLPFDRTGVLGALADHIRIDPEYRTALEAVLRFWLDALIVKDEHLAAECVSYMAEQDIGALRLLSNESASDLPPASDSALPGRPLLDLVQCGDEVRPVMARLLAPVRLVDHLRDTAGCSDPSVTFVTATGAVRRNGFVYECWSPEETDNPLARKQQLDEWQKDLDDLQAQQRRCEDDLKAVDEGAESLRERLRTQQAVLDEKKEALAVRRGERQAVASEAAQVRQRLETVSYELNAITSTGDSSAARRADIQRETDQRRERQSELRKETAELNEELRTVEKERSEGLSELTEQRVRSAEKKREQEYLESRRQTLEARIEEFKQTISERDRGLNDYQQRIERLTAERDAAAAAIEPLQEQLNERTAALENARSERDAKQHDVEQVERELHEQRAALESARDAQSRLDIERAEKNMQRKNLEERVMDEYRVSREDILAEPEPEWPDGERPPREDLETEVAELRAKIESMGPVNLVAIEEHQALEERFAFLTQQQDDLLAAKDQLLDLIKKINQTTTEMFSQTFHAVNENFQRMFKELFGGGSAKLVLVNEEDVLESGIEIIARPPGKKLQTVSLLSGGERTMTAVALLFALYLVKPSPFCVLDELDAALDDANIGRFVNVVKGFVKNSQFVVITHNRQTIAAADVLYGVTMQVRGVSKIVSAKFRSEEGQPVEELISA